VRIGRSAKHLPQYIIGALFYFGRDTIDRCAIPSRISLKSGKCVLSKRSIALSIAFLAAVETGIHGHLDSNIVKGSENPLMEGKLGTLKYGTHGNGVLLAAVAAEVHAFAVGLAFQLGLAIRAAAVRAKRALRPAEVFKVLAGGYGVVEAGGGEVHVSYF
jgi:hypothetical protein